MKIILQLTVAILLFSHFFLSMPTTLAKGFKSDCSGNLWIKEKAKYDRSTITWLVNSARQIVKTASTNNSYRVSKSVSYSALINGKGQIVKLSILKSSEDTAIDKIAKDLILKSSPFRSPPMGVLKNNKVVFLFNPEQGYFVDVDEFLSNLVF